MRQPSRLTYPFIRPHSGTLHSKSVFSRNSRNCHCPDHPQPRFNWTSIDGCRLWIKNRLCLSFFLRFVFPLDLLVPLSPLVHPTFCPSCFSLLLFSLTLTLTLNCPKLGRTTNFEFIKELSWNRLISAKCSFVHLTGQSPIWTIRVSSHLAG